jgi:hypothetical protein
MTEPHTRARELLESAFNPRAVHVLLEVFALREPAPAREVGGDAMREANYGSAISAIARLQEIATAGGYDGPLNTPDLLAWVERCHASHKGDREKLATAIRERDELAHEIGQALALRAVDFASGETVEPREHAIWHAMRDTIRERDEARAEVKRLAERLATLIGEAEHALGRLRSTDRMPLSEVSRLMSQAIVELQRATKAALKPPAAGGERDFIGANDPSRTRHCVPKDGE